MASNGFDVGTDRPVIGLTTYLQPAQTGVWDVRASFLPAIYFEGVGLAGGISVLLPPQPVDAGIAERVLDGLDGLIVTGGRDVVTSLQIGNVCREECIKHAYAFLSIRQC